MMLLALVAIIITPLLLWYAWRAYRMIIEDKLIYLFASIGLGYRRSYALSIAVILAVMIVFYGVLVNR